MSGFVIRKGTHHCDAPGVEKQAWEQLKANKQTKPATWKAPKAGLPPCSSHTAGCGIFPRAALRVGALSAQT